MMADLSELIFEKNVTQIQHALRENRLTSVELVEYYLHRISVFDGILNSIITINPKALEQAAELDKKRKQGEYLGVLHGIPIVLKDNFDTYDLPTTSGAKAFEKLQPHKDAFIVDKLRKAGAIILAKTNLTEMANHGMTVSSAVGQTLNPYDLTRTPGGSSGGTGASITANFAVMGTGSDTVNSIRSPASANALVGIRASRGLVSRSGISPCSDLQDMVGPIARCVEDAAIMLSVISGYDHNDESTLPMKGKNVPDFTSGMKNYSLKNKRICLVSNIAGSDPDVLRIVDNAVFSLRENGAEVIVREIEELYVPDLLKNNDVQLFEQKLCLDKYLSDCESRYSPIRSTEEYVGTGLLTPSIVDDMRKKSLIKDPDSSPEYIKRLSRNRKLKEFIEKYMKDNSIDAFMYPLQNVLPVRTDDKRGQTGRNGLIASVTGLPAITVPGGFSKSDETARIGVPIGIEFLSEIFTENKLIGIAYAFEQATKHRKPPIGFPDLAKIRSV